MADLSLDGALSHLGDTGVVNNSQRDQEKYNQREGSVQLTGRPL